MVCFLASIVLFRRSLLFILVFSITFSGFSLCFWCREYVVIAADVPYIIPLEMTWFKGHCVESVAMSSRRERGVLMCQS